MSNSQNPKLFLASSSPRRKKLLSTAGWRFKTLDAAINETPNTHEQADAYVLRMAVEKVNAVIRQLKSQYSSYTGQDNQSICIIAADTIVVDGNEILGKPRDDAEAVAMLSRLRAHIHEVYSALAVAFLEQKTESKLYDIELTHPLVTDVCITEVIMRYYSDDEIITYVASGDALDKAGAYAIQNNTFNPVASLKGCFANVIGLPLCRLAPILGQFNVKPYKLNEAFARCCLQANLDDYTRMNCCQTIWTFDDGNEAI